MKNLKRIIAIFISATLLTVGLTGCANSNKTDNKAEKETETQTEEKAATTDSEEEITVRISYWEYNIWGSLLVFAQEWGIVDDVFEGTNVKLELIPFQDGPTANEAVTAGELDFELSLGDQPFLTGNENGVDTVILAATARQEESLVLVAGSDSDIESPADLAGKNIAVGIGQYTHKSLIGILQDNNIDINDVELTNYTVAGDVVTAISRGDVDAYIGSIFDLNASIEDGTLKKIGDCTGHPANVYLVGTNAFVKEHPEITEKIVEVVYKSANYFTEHFDEVSGYVAETVGLEQEDVKNLMPLVDLDVDLREEDVEAIKVTQDFLIDNDILTEELENLEEDHIDDSFIKKVRAGE